MMLSAATFNGLSKTESYKIYSALFSKKEAKGEKYSGERCHYQRLHTENGTKTAVQGA